MQKAAYILGALVILSVGGYFVYKNLPTSIPSGPVACTMDAMRCPDGSFVGRTGPKCEFVCPGGQPGEGEENVGSITQDSAINKTISAFGFSVTPTSVVQDSRCPVDVQCIQAGTVVVKAKLSGGLGEYTANLELNKPLVNEEVSVTLISVSPAPLSSVKPNPGDYVFTFRIEKNN